MSSCSYGVAAEQLALPVPSEPVLLAAGVLAGAGLLRLPSAIAVGVAASSLSDVIWYEIGRARGSQVMRLLCRISLEPDSCVRPSEWQRVVDTAQESPDDIREPDRGVALTSARYTVGPRSVVVLMRPWSV
jgi:hypothetical protein